MVVNGGVCFLAIDNPSASNNTIGLLGQWEFGYSGGYGYTEGITWSTPQGGYIADNGLGANNTWVTGYVYGDRRDHQNLGNFQFTPVCFVQCANTGFLDYGVVESCHDLFTNQSGCTLSVSPIAIDCAKKCQVHHLSGGAVAGIVIGSIVGMSAFVAACCYRDSIVRGVGDCVGAGVRGVGAGVSGIGDWGQQLCAGGYNYTRENCIPSMRSMRDKVLELCGGRPGQHEHNAERRRIAERQRIADAAERRRQRVMEEMQPTRDNERTRQPQEPDIDGNSSRIGPSMPSERSGFRDNGIEQPVQPIEHPVQQDNQDTVDNLMSEYEDNNRRNTRFVRDLYNNIREILREAPPEDECLRKVRDLYRNKMNAALNIGLIRGQFALDFRNYVEQVAETEHVPDNLYLKFSNNIDTITKLVTNLEEIFQRHDLEEVLLIQVRELYTNTLRNSATSGMSRQELAQEFRYCVEKLMNDRDVLENTRARVMEYDRMG